MRPGVIIALGGLLLAGGAHAETTGDAAAGKKLAGQCRTCHGLDGYAKIPIAPHIGGEPAEYLEAQLMAFKTGTREHEMMSVVASRVRKSARRSAVKGSCRQAFDIAASRLSAFSCSSASTELKPRASA